MNVSDTLATYLGGFVRQLERAGVTHAVVCPGSRSTPLAVILSRSPSIQVWIQIDERSAAFFAYGIAKRTGRAVVLVSTSGTAAANFLPAITEASLSRVPLLVLTADRPRELRDVGAPQTIDQVQLYGRHVKWFQDMPEPQPNAEIMRMAQIVAARSVQVASTAPKGPVHLNFPFREPLLPSTAEIEASQTMNIDWEVLESASSSDRLAQWVAEIPDNAHGLIVAGPGDYQNVKSRLFQLAQQLGWPVLADPLSNLRGYPGVISTYDALLRDPRQKNRLAAEWVIRFGAPPVSKVLNEWVMASRLILVDEPGGYREPNLQGPKTLYGSLPGVIQELLEKTANRVPDPGWSPLWQESQRTVQDKLANTIQLTPPTFEGRLFYDLDRYLPAVTQLSVLVSNSMPIRDLDSFYHPDHPGLRFYGNRGANGIDGLVSTALGISAVDGKVVAILGDLAFYHDMNGLLASTLHHLNALIIVINNRGGGIFSFLPQKQTLAEETFEKFFGTPHTLNFSAAAQVYGGTFRRIRELAELKDLTQTDEWFHGLQIVEWMTDDRDTNYRWHQTIWQILHTEENHDALS